ncbi:MAG: DUF72 domain-containing protein [Hymenobacter sp.]
MYITKPYPHIRPYLRRMDFGRLPDLRYVDFRLPPTTPTRPACWPAPRPTYPPRLYVGCPIWTNKEWLGSYFPLGVEGTRFSALYAQQFNSIELNTTHYRIPDAPTGRRWREAVGPGFKFCPKLPRSISHERELYNTDDLTLTLHAAPCRSWATTWARCFLQLPPHFGPEHLPRLERFLLDWPADVPLAVELRHPRWFCG